MDPKIILAASDEILKRNLMTGMCRGGYTTLRLGYLT
jgi:hypothetical protein